MSKQTEQDIKNAKQLAITSAELFYHYRLIARSVNRDEDTLIKWRKADKQFAEQLEQGRLRFLKKHMANAKAEFLLERMERELFAPVKQQLEHSGGDPIKILLAKYGVTEEIQVDGQADGVVQSPPKSSP